MAKISGAMESLMQVDCSAPTIAEELVNAIDEQDAGRRTAKDNKDVGAFGCVVRAAGEKAKQAGMWSVAPPILEKKQDEASQKNYR